MPPRHFEEHVEAEMKFSCIISTLNHHSRNISQHYSTTHSLHSKTLPLLNALRGRHIEERKEMLEHMRAANNAADCNVRSMQEILRWCLEHGADFEFVDQRPTMEMKRELEVRVKVEEDRLRGMRGMEGGLEGEIEGLEKGE